VAFVSGSGDDKKRNTAAGSDVNMDNRKDGRAGGWE
jgi:hypothetical protein